MRHFTYSGNLEDAIEKAERDLQKEKENKEIAQWYWLYEKAKKAINTHNKKIANIEAFIRCAEEEQEKQKGKKGHSKARPQQSQTIEMSEKSVVERSIEIRAHSNLVIVKLTRRK